MLALLLLCGSASSAAFELPPFSWDTVPRFVHCGPDYKPPTPGKQRPPLVILIRHGQTTHNKLGLFTGWEDASLAKEGIAEAKRAGQLLRAHGFAVDAVYTSWRRRGVSHRFMITRASARLARRRRAAASRR